VLPRRSYPTLTGRLLHDRSADKMAHAISRIPDAIATIIPFDVRHKTEALHTALPVHADTTRPATPAAAIITTHPAAAAPGRPVLRVPAPGAGTTVKP